MSEFFTADWHLDHAMMVRRGVRPFPSVEEMNHTIISRCNERVGEGDILHVLGDLSLGRPEQLTRHLNQLRCKCIRVIWGNHDRAAKKLKDRFQWAKDYNVVHAAGHIIILSHYAFRVWDRSHYGTWHLYGHSHGSLPDDPHAFSMDVGVDCHQFYPLSIQEIAACMAKKSYKPVDHHRGDKKSCKPLSPLVPCSPPPTLGV